MSTLHFQILHLWRHTPGLYILLVTVPFLLFFFVMLKNIKNSNPIQARMPYYPNIK